MARYIGLSTDEPNVAAEAQVANALRQLNDDWTVLHHVAWQSARYGREGDGEADFVIIHPRYGVLVLEVKGGKEISIDRGRWMSTSRQGDVFAIKNPYEQATASKHTLFKWLEALNLSNYTRIGHAVCFPGLGAMPQMGLLGTPEITWVAPDLSRIADTVKRTCNHWELSSSFTEEQLRQLVDFLAPTLTIRRPLSLDSAEAESGIVSLTAEQIDVFSGLKSRRGGLVLGGAGTGKTVLAVARAQQLACGGFNVLFVCFNELLGKELANRSSGSPNLKVQTFHSLCFEQAKAAGLRIPGNIGPTWWEVGAPEILIEAAAATATSFDAIVIDEAQDFSPAWIDALRCLISSRPDAPFYLFADPRQDLWQRKWDNGLDAQFTYSLHLNMRNTYPIAQRVAAAVGSDARIRELPGPKPIWRDIPDAKKVDREAIAAVERLLDEGFGPGHIVVLCDSAKRVEKLREYTVGEYSLGSWGGRGIPVETVARFKGMESRAIILVLEDETSNQFLAKCYVGMSRARSLLFVVGSQRLHRPLNWN